MTTDDLAGLLAEHGNAVVAEREGELKRHWRCAACNTDLGVGRLGDLDQLVAAHQAAVIAAAGWVKGREEWGVRYSSHVGDFEQAKISEHIARVTYEDDRDEFAGTRAVAVVRRHVTDWEEIKDA